MNRGGQEEHEEIFQDEQINLDEEQTVENGRANENQNNNIEDQNELRFFSVDEVGDLLKSRKNLIYMFRLSCYLISLLSSS